MNKSIILAALMLCGTNALADDTSWRQWFSSAIRDIPRFIIENQVSIPVHGNYCGPSHGDGNYQEMPVDGIDMACMRHDYCFDPAVGGTYLSCGCDYQLVEDIAEAIRESGSLNRSTTLGLGIAGWFSHSACMCKDKFGATNHLASPTIFQKMQCQL